MDISVIIPCHNLENYITPLCVSLNMQNLYQFSAELVFVLDNCTDNTQQKIRRFPWDLNKFKINLLQGSFGSCGAARNHGLAYAEGDIIWFVDGDDWLTDANAIAQIVNAFKQTEYKAIKFLWSAPSDYPTLYQRNMMVWQYAYRREAIGDIKFPNTQPDEDFIFNKAVFAQEGMNLGLLSLPFYYYNFMREGSNMYQFYTEGKVGS